MTVCKVAVILSSVRQGRMNERVGKFVTKRLKEQGFEVFLVDPKVHIHPMLEGRFAYMKNPPDTMIQTQKTLKEADCYVICSAEYNHTIPPALSNLMSYYFDEYEKKPAGICCYSAGGFGGIRAAIALRPFLSELGLVTLPTLFPISSVGKSLDAEGSPLDDGLPDRFDSFAKELKWYAETLKKGREAQVN